VKQIAVTFFYCLLFNIVIAQKITTKVYIDTYKTLAVAEMLRAGVPASITLAQGILETESGNSVLVKKSNNHFGIKCKVEWTGESVYHDDDESGECFRKYDSAIFSYRDHSDFLRTRSHYAFLFSLDPMDYKGWAYGLKKAGYATNPRYPEILIKTIEDNQLNDITEITLSQIPDYSIYQLEANKSKFTFVDKSIKKINQIVEPSKLKAKTYNGLKAVYADSGMSILAIATHYDIPLSIFLEFNDLITDGLLEKSCWLYLQRKREEGLLDRYKVNKNESLYEISQSNGLQLSSLLAYNGLDEKDDVAVGTILSLKSGVIIKEEEIESVIIADESNSKKSKRNEKIIKQQKKVFEEKYKIHKVKSGESLELIAKKYKVNIDDLKILNGLISNKIKIGQQLMIPK
jgi:LysM repeat protein